MRVCVCMCSSPQAAPSTLGCRSTHSSPVHSASSRLTQGFSVSVPTLLFAGMKPRHRSSDAPRARQCRQVPHDPVTTQPRPYRDLSPPTCSSLADSYDIISPSLQLPKQPFAKALTVCCFLKGLWPTSDQHSAVTQRCGFGFRVSKLCFCACCRQAGLVKATEIKSRRHCFGWLKHASSQRFNFLHLFFYIPARLPSRAFLSVLITFICSTLTAYRQHAFSFSLYFSSSHTFTSSNSRNRAQLSRMNLRVRVCWWSVFLPALIGQFLGRRPRASRYPQDLPPLWEHKPSLPSPPPSPTAASPPPPTPSSAWPPKPVRYPTPPDLCQMFSPCRPLFCC